MLSAKNIYLFGSLISHSTSGLGFSSQIVINNSIRCRTTSPYSRSFCTSSNLLRVRSIKPHKHDFEHHNHPHYHAHKLKNDKSKRPSFLNRLLIACGFLAIGYSIGKQIALTSSSPSEQQLNKRHKFIEDTPEYKYLHNHPMVQQLRNDPNFDESQYCEAIPAYHQDVMVTSGKLSGRGLLTVEPLVFTSKKSDLIEDGQQMYVFYHVGDQITHHQRPDSVHTGLLATLMDEGLSRCAFSRLPSKYGVTASLELDYRSPLPPDSFIVLRAKNTDARGRKSWAQGTLEVLTVNSNLQKGGEIIVEGKVLMIEPKWAKYLVWLFN